MSRHQRLANQALRVALTNIEDLRYKFGAVLVRKGKVLAKASNTSKTHTIVVNYPRQSLHAESNALSKIDDPTGCTLYIVRARSGKFAPSRPCPFCRKLIAKFKIDKVYFFEETPTGVRLVSERLI